MKNKIILLFIFCLLTGHIWGQSYTVSTIAGNGTAGSTGDGGPATAALVTAPTDIVVDQAGNVYFCDMPNNSIRKIDINGNITLIAGTGTAGVTGDGGPATSAQLFHPAFLAIDDAGNLYVSSACRVRKITASSGLISTIVGDGTSAYSGDGGPATGAQITWSSGMTIDNSGNIYLADDTRIRKIDGYGVITTIAGIGTRGFSGDLGPATAAQFNGASDVVIDGSGNIYVGEGYGKRIRKIDGYGVITTIAGNGGTGVPSGDGGPATAAYLHNGGMISIDNNNDIYFSEYGSIRKISSGIINTIVGTSGIGSASGDCGPATSAVFDGILGVAVDRNHNIYITDGDGANRRVRMAYFPPSITGGGTICVGASLTLTAATGILNGSWTSSNTAIATVNSAGIVGGVGAGTATITYSVTSSCGTDYATATVNVSNGPSVAAISGSSTTLCVGANLTLSDATGGGTWSSSTPAAATVSSSGVVHGVAGGSATISYAVTNSCGTTTVTYAITVNTPPSVDAISGSDMFCKNDVPIAYTCTTPSGTWSMSGTSNRLAISSGGSVTIGPVPSNLPTAATVYYAVTNSCGTTTVHKDIYAKGYGAISGSGSFCVGGGKTYTGSPSGGTWSYSSGEPGTHFSSSPSGSSINLTGLSAGGTQTISYSASPDADYCALPYATRGVSVASSTITLSTAPATSMVAGSSVTVTSHSGGGYSGTWTSSASSIASVSAGSASAKPVYGISPGTATITFTGSGACPTVVTVTLTVTSPRGIGTTEVGSEVADYNVTIAPNPSLGTFNIELPESVNTDATIAITEITGKIIETRNTNTRLNTFDLSNYPRGMYMISIATGGKKYTGKVLLK